MGCWASELKWFKALSNAYRSTVSTLVRSFTLNIYSSHQTPKSQFPKTTLLFDSSTWAVGRSWIVVDDRWHEAEALKKQWKRLTRSWPRTEPLRVAVRVVVFLSPTWTLLICTTIRDCWSLSSNQAGNSVIKPRGNKWSEHTEFHPATYSFLVDRLLLEPKVLFENPNRSLAQRLDS